MYNYDGFFKVIENAGQVARIFIAKSRAPFVGALFVLQSRRFSAGKRQGIKGSRNGVREAFPFIMLGLLGYARKGARRDRIECARVGFVGAGKVGTALGGLFRSCGIVVFMDTVRCWQKTRRRRLS